MTLSTKSAAATQTAYEEPSIQVDQDPQIQQPKRKRGRPSKNTQTQPSPIVNAPSPVLVTEEDIQLMSEVEAACPYPKDEYGQYGVAGTGWCNDEFARRKQAIVKKAEAVEDKAFTAEAKQSDKRIDKALTRGSESFFEAVKELIHSGEKGYYKALGFKSFNSYRESKSQYSRSHIGQGIQAYKALHTHIPDDKLITIPLPSAVLLTKIPESKLTPEVIEAAASMKIQEFKEQEFPKHASLLVDATTGQSQPVAPEEFAWIPRMRVHKQVADVWKKMLEIARWKASGLQDDTDVYQNFSADEKALLVIFYECANASGWAAEFDASKYQSVENEEPAF